jgi:hypothetical protein
MLAQVCPITPTSTSGQLVVSPSLTLTPIHLGLYKYVFAGLVLTITNNYYKPSTKHEKGIYQPPNIELGFKLIEFYRFWWICVSIGVYQENEARYQGCQGKNHIPPRNQVEKGLEDTRRWPTKGGSPRSHPSRSTPPQVGRPMWVPLVSLNHKSVLYCLRVCIFAIDQGWFDLRDLVHPASLYKLSPYPLGSKHSSHLIKSSEPETLVSLELHHILEHSYIG